MNTAHSTAGSYGSIGRLASTGDPDNGYEQRDYKDKDIICPKVDSKATVANMWTALCLKRQLQKSGGCAGTRCKVGLAILAQHGLKGHPSPKKKKAPVEFTEEKKERMQRHKELVKLAKTYQPIRCVANAMEIRKEQLYQVMRLERALPVGKEQELCKLINFWKREE